MSERRSTKKSPTCKENNADRLPVAEPYGSHGEYSFFYIYLEILSNFKINNLKIDSP